MRVLGLDVSTKTGFAVIDDGKLVCEGLLTVEPVILEDRVEDFSLLDRAQRMVEQINLTIIKHRPDMIFIEQTNAGKFRSAQKQLEFIHCTLLHSLLTLRTTGKDYIRNLRYVDTSKWRSMLEIKLTKDQRKHNKSVKEKTARGKITPKHLAVAWVNQKYNLSLKLKDNDRADAICLATFGYLNGQQPTSVNFDIDSIVLNK